MLRRARNRPVPIDLRAVSHGVKMQKQRIGRRVCGMSFREGWSIDSRIGCLTFAGTGRKAYRNQSSGRGGTGRRKGLKIRCAC